MESDLLCWNAYEDSLCDVTDRKQLLHEYIETIIEMTDDSSDSDVITNRLNQLVKVVRICISRSESVITPDTVQRIMTSLTRHQRVEDAMGIIDGIMDDSVEFGMIHLKFSLKVDVDLEKVGQLFVKLKPDVANLTADDQVSLTE